MIAWYVHCPLGIIQQSIQKPCIVSIETLPSLTVLWVLERSGERGPIGRMFEHLFLLAEAECIMCTVGSTQFV